MEIIVIILIILLIFIYVAVLNSEFFIKYMGTKNEIEVITVGKDSAKFFREGDITKALYHYSLIRLIHKDKLYITRLNWFGKLIYNLKYKWL